MNKHFGLMFGAVTIALASAPSFGQTTAVAVQAPRITVSAPAIATTIAAPVVVTTNEAPAIATTIARPPIATTVSAQGVAAPAVVTKVTQPTVAVTAPQAVPAPAPAAPPAPPAPPAVAEQSAPQKPPAPPATPKPATAAPKPPEPPQAPEPTPAPGRERIDPDPVNIRFDVTITYQSGTTAPVKRTAVLTVANNTGDFFSRGSLRSGNNVPVPMSTVTSRSEDGKETPAAKPLTSYSYRSVGLNVDVQRAAIVPGNRVRATLNIEFSGVDEKTGPGSAGAAPSFPTFSQGIGLYLENGKPVLVAQSSDVVDNVERKQMVEVKATILR